MPRAPRPSDLVRLRIPTDPRLSPDGGLVVVTMQTSAPLLDGYRHALWAVPTDGGPARQLTLGSRHDRHPRFSPDGTVLGFLSDRRTLVEEEPGLPSDDEREDGIQVHLLPLDGGEARRLTDLPRGAESFSWSPDGRRLVVVTTSHGATRAEDAKRRSRALRREPAALPESDFRYIDRLEYMLNGEGFTYDRIGHLWIVEVETGHARRLTGGPTPEESPAWSPDGTRIAFSANRRRDHDLYGRHDLFVVEVETGIVTAVTAGPRSCFGAPVWMPDGRTIVAMGHRMPAGGASRNDIWLFAADGSDARADGGRNLSEEHDLMPGSGMNSDVTPGEEARLVPSRDGRSITFSAPIRGAYELWRIETADGRLERLTQGRHYISGWDEGWDARGASRLVYLRSSPVEPADVWLLEGPREPRRLSVFNADVLGELELREPEERWVSVDGRDIQGWLIPGAGDGVRPGVLEIHGGPHTVYGWSPMWEFQVLAGAGISVVYANPRGSEGYGQAFNAANHRDWGDGPMRDVLAHVDAAVDDGLIDGKRLGVTGGSYGGYLTTWIVGHDRRFQAAMTCRSVADMAMLQLTGDISGVEWSSQEFGVVPWEDPDYYRAISPLTYAGEIRTPLLIQHSEKDLRTTIAQAEALFTTLRTLKRPVRLMRVPEETHELTRSGTPFRRVENLEVVLGWFRHFLIDGKRRLPPVPRIHGGR